MVAGLGHVAYITDCTCDRVEVEEVGSGEVGEDVVEPRGTLNMRRGLETNGPMRVVLSREVEHVGEEVEKGLP